MEAEGDLFLVTPDNELVDLRPTGTPRVRAGDAWSTKLDVFGGTPGSKPVTVSVPVSTPVGMK